MSREAIAELNQPLFDQARTLALPLGHFAITASGPLGVRGLRIMNDVDILVDGTLWTDLSLQYGVGSENGLPKIDTPYPKVEIAGPPTFPARELDPSEPTIDKQIQEAEVIDNLPFVPLRHILFFKQRRGGKQDLRDVDLIRAYLREERHPN